MNCIMCNKRAVGGTTIRGIKRGYRICKACLLKHTWNRSFKLSKDYSHKQKEQIRTKQMQKYIQEEVDNRLNKYLLGDTIWN